MSAPTSVRAGRVAPDVTQFVFTCLAPSCTWQVQTSRRARLSFGSALALYHALAEASHEHQSAEHPGWEPEGMTTADGKQASGGLMGQPLPRWWVEKA